MLLCKKCHRLLTEGLAHQAMSEMETTLLARLPAIEAHRHAMMKGPLCDPCLATWQEQQLRESTPKAAPVKKTEPVQKTAPVQKADPVQATKASAPLSRSPAMKRLDEACEALGRETASRFPR